MATLNNVGDDHRIIDGGRNAAMGDLKPPKKEPRPFVAGNAQRGSSCGFAKSGPIFVCRQKQISAASRPMATAPPFGRFAKIDAPDCFTKR
ncbi:MAG TPA: hypothetical protein VII20_17300 [Roseiarcus sp.]|jgi:hypothetical protein